MSEPDAFHQLALRFIDPVQHDYEVIRGIMLADETIAERSRVTGIDRATVGEKARRFVEGGMRGLIDQRTTTTKGQHRYPDVVASYILYLRQLYPPIRAREIARIVGRKYGYKTNHHTVMAFLERNPILVQLPLPVTGFHQFDDAYRARWTVVRLFYEGWRRSSIAGLLGLSRQHVWNILAGCRASCIFRKSRMGLHAQQSHSRFPESACGATPCHERAGRPVSDVHRQHVARSPAWLCGKRRNLYDNRQPSYATVAAPDCPWTDRGRR